MSFPFQHLVELGYQQLKAEGHVKELPPGNQQAVEDQKGAITRRGAYYANLEDSNWGILEKTSGNNSMGYSTDIIIHRVTGQFYDVASDNGLTAFPVNGGEHVDPGLIPRWRQPTRELALIDEPVPEPEPEPEPEPPPDDVKELLIALLNNSVETKAAVDLLVARQDTTDAHLNDARRMLREIQLKQEQHYKFRIFGQTITIVPE